MKVPYFYLLAGAQWAPAFGHFQLETKGNIVIRYLRLEMSIVNFLVELSREKDRNTQKYGRSRNKTTRYYPPPPPPT